MTNNLDSNVVLPEDELIDALARKIVGLKLDVPVVFLLESHKPLSNIGHHLALICQPLMGPFMGDLRTKAILKLLSERENLERLINSIQMYTLRDTN